MRKVLALAGFIAAAHVTFGASTYTVHNLISDIPNPGGTPDPNVIIDPNLVDPWGISEVGAMGLLIWTRYRSDRARRRS